MLNEIQAEILRQVADMAIESFLKMREAEGAGSRRIF